ncbi:scaffolding protein [Metabacillus sp. BG109]|uniref:Scaffolding protein n=2 Tax=Metabacillus bambusae TaxID=2795218 RepID=A0ABS3N9T4_9BACI|nr:scaffolding protein [Metabacillus bambusae]
MFIWLLFTKEKEVKQTPTLLPLNLQFFSEGGDGGEGGEGAGSGEDEPFATFKSKEDLNKRLGRAEKKGQKELATQLGYDSVEEMLASLNPDNDKDKDKKEKDKDKKDDPIDVDALLESKLREERDKTFKRLVNSEVKLLANELGFADWEDALALSDLTEVKEDDKGNIVGVKEALEALAKKKPHLLKQTTNGAFGVTVPNNGGAGGSQKDLEDIKKLAASRGSKQTSANNPWA